MLQVRRENARHIFRDMPAYTTLLLGKAAPVDDAAAHGFGSGDTANSGHNVNENAA